MLTGWRPDLMKNYFLSVCLIAAAISISAAISTLSSSEVFLDGSTLNKFAFQSVPQNNSTVLGIKKVNLPPVSKNLSAPELSARAVLVEDLDSGQILYQKNASVRVPIASTTKIMTSIIASSFYKQNSPLIVGIGADVPGSRVGLVKGETLSFRSLLYGMLLNSGNDAAYTIAENYPGGVLSFVSAMNQEAAKLNLNNTHFDNPVGFDSPNHYSSASDLSKITKEALKNNELSKIFATKETQVSSLDKHHTYKLHNLNILLSKINGMVGVKTGYTEEAKENLVGLVNRSGHPVLTVVLGSNDRFGETTKLIDWVYNDFTWSGTDFVQ